MSPKPPKASLAVIFGIVVLDLIGFGILIPQLGIYAVKFQASPLAAGLLLSVYSLMQFLFAPVLGRLSDRHGRRPVLLLSVTGSLIGYLLFAVAGSLQLLFLARIIDGISGGNIATAQAYVADVTTADNRAKGMGLVGAAFGIGFLLGPAVGGILGSVGGNLAIGLGAGSLCLLNLVLAFLFLPESLPREQRAALPKRSAVSLGALPQRLRAPITGRVLLLFLVFMVAFAQMEGTFSIFVLSQHLAPGMVPADGGWLTAATVADEPRLRAASLKVGYLFAAVGLVSAVVQGGLLGRLKTRFGEGRLAVAGLALAGLGIGAIPLSPSYAWFFVPVVLMAVGSGLVNPSLSALMSIHSPREKQGEMLGAYQSMGSLGRILGPATGGLLFSTLAPSAPYWVASVMLLMGVMLGLRLWAELRSVVVQPAR